MPTPEQILAGLADISNQWRLLAGFWHAYFGVLVVALLVGARLGKRGLGILLALPLLSVSALAWAHGNPFNGSLFALLGMGLMAIAVTLPRGDIGVGPPWAVVVGSSLFLFGWVYPHFLDTPSWLPYLYATPTGLIPCPTLSIVIGLSLALSGLDSRAWSWVLAAAGTFYGVFGAARLGVTIDWILLLGALMTATVVIAGANQPRSRSVGG
jgi:hypothetical protein